LAFFINFSSCCCGPTPGRKNFCGPTPGRTQDVKILAKDVLPSLELSVSEVARRLGISRQQYLWHAEQRMKNELSKIETAA
jgi:hypothetical protein